MIEKMAIATALRGFNDLGHSVTPTFLFRTDFIYNDLHIVIYTFSKNEHKLRVGS